MSFDTPFTCLTNDTGMVSEILHVSPVFMRIGRRTRGEHSGQREIRAGRSEARRHRKSGAADGGSAESVLRRSGN